MAAEIEPLDLDVRLLAMRRRHLRSVLRIESKVYPVPWSMSLFLSELAEFKLFLLPAFTK